MPENTIFRWLISELSRYFQINQIYRQNLPKLTAFESLGSRIFRVTKFDKAYLKNLEYIPKITFYSKAGKILHTFSQFTFRKKWNFQGAYEACDHWFEYPNDQIFEANFDSTPISTWKMRHFPEIRIPSLHKSANFHIVIMLDIVSGRILYFSYNFPMRTKVNINMFRFYCHYLINMWSLYRFYKNINKS